MKTPSPACGLVTVRATVTGGCGSFLAGISLLGIASVRDHARCWKMPSLSHQNLMSWPTNSWPCKSHSHTSLFLPSIHRPSVAVGVRSTRSRESGNIRRRILRSASGNGCGRALLNSLSMENSLVPARWTGTRSTTPSHQPLHRPASVGVGMITSMPSVLKPQAKTVLGCASRDDRPERPFEGKRERNGVRFSVHSSRFAWGNR